jgi:hypothetical protein
MLGPVSSQQSRPARASVPRNPRTEIVYASCALFFSLVSWWINPYFVPGLLGVAFAVRVLLHVRGLVGRQRNIAFGLAIAALILGVLGIIGTILVLFVRFG